MKTILKDSAQSLFSAAMALVMTLTPGYAFALASAPTNLPILVSTSTPAALVPPAPEPKVLDVVMTAYSSTPDQTDSTPFIAANGQHVYDGMVAANFLPFGTKIKIPALFGDKVFTVGDRMNQKFNSRVDVWMPTRTQAVRFGVRITQIVILP
ncbi:3D domain-containing protein [Patescibacteria group bacterium]|nr:3D domain-containing protein [Patescibacteria group bacterium]